MISHKINEPRGHLWALPHPTEAWFFADESSLQGPVTLVAAVAIRSSDPGA